MFRLKASMIEELPEFEAKLRTLPADWTVCSVAVSNDRCHLLIS